MDPDAAKSRSGWIIKLDDCPIAFASRKQGEAALSTVEAEYLALSMAMRELLWLRRIVQEVADGFQVAYNPKSVVHSTVWEDNQGCIAVARRPDHTARTRHIVTKYHHFKDNIRVDASGNGIEIAFCPSAEMEADIMTKGVKRELFLPLRDKLMGWHLQRNHVGLIGELKNTAVEEKRSQSEKSTGIREVSSVPNGDITTPGMAANLAPSTDMGVQKVASDRGNSVGVKCDSCGSRKCV
jgi:hypothetical protein